MYVYINEISILVSAILAVAILTVWYSPDFFGRKEDDVLGNTPTLSAVVMFVAQNLIVYVIFFSVIAYFIPEPGSAKMVYIKLGVFVSLVIAMHVIALGLREKRTWRSIIVDIGYSALIISSGISVMSLWPW